MSMLIKMQPGSEEAERIDLLCSLTNLSQNTIGAIKYHLVNGAKITLSATLHDIEIPNLVRSINTINETNGIVQSIIDFDKYRTGHDFKYSGKASLKTGLGIYKCTKCGAEKEQNING